MTALTVGQLREALASADPNEPVYLEVLGDVIDVEGVAFHGSGAYVVGAEEEG